MSIPEIDKAIVKFLDFVDEPIVLSVFKNDRQACYEAGKRDAVPAWPTKATDVVFERKKDCLHYRLCAQVWFQHFGKTERVSHQMQNILTAAYFMGELEEVEQ